MAMSLGSLEVVKRSIKVKAQVSMREGFSSVVYCSPIINLAPRVTCDALSDLEHPDKPKLGSDKRKNFGHDVIFGPFFHNLEPFWNFVTL